jgi:hypothetical protein
VQPDAFVLAQVAAQYSIPPAILFAVGEAETGYGDGYVSGSQRGGSGEWGAFQFMPATLQGYGFTGQQIAGNFELQAELAARMLHDLFQKYGGWQAALSAYNSGSPTGAPSYASKVLGIAGQDPSYGMGAQGAQGPGTAQGATSGYAPSDLAFWRGASGDFTNALQGMSQGGGVVSPDVLASYRMQASQVGQGATGHGVEGLSGFNGQCVGWVEKVLPWVPYGPATAADYAAALPQVPGVRQSSAAGAQPGDVVVFAPGQAGADSSAGHIAVVTGVGANGDITVSQANWDENGQPSVMTIPAETAQGLSFFSPPPQDVQASAQAAVESMQAAQSTGGVSSLSSARSPQPATLTSSVSRPGEQGQGEVDPSAIAAFAQEAQAHGIDPQHLTDNISTAIAMMRYVTGKDTMSLAQYGPLNGMDQSAMLDWFRQQPHGTYPGLTSGQFMDTAHAASIPSIQYQSRQPEPAEVARFASAGYTPQMMSQYYQQTAKSGAGPTAAATAETFSTTHGGSGIRSE